MSVAQKMYLTHNRLDIDRPMKNRIFIQVENELILIFRGCKSTFEIAKKMSKER